LVEDNPDDVVVIKRAFRRSGLRHTLENVRDGEEALDRLYGVGEHENAPLPDIILLDINIPKINGLEVLAKIKGNPNLRRIPVIVLTISEREEDMAKAYDSGAASYMTKPVDTKGFEELITTLEDYWRVARLPAGESPQR